jgi:hypothetical protein
MEPELDDLRGTMERNFLTDERIQATNGFIRGLNMKKWKVDPTNR